MKKRGRPFKEETARLVLPPIRVTEEQRSRYKQAADEQGKKLSSWLRDIADKESKRILE